jgi:hypothetical protein
MGRGAGRSVFLVLCCCICACVGDLNALMGIKGDGFVLVGGDKAFFRGLVVMGANATKVSGMLLHLSVEFDFRTCSEICHSGADSRGECLGCCSRRSWRC